MNTHFHIENKEFADYIKLTANGNEYYFQKDITIEYDDCDSLDVDIEVVKAEEYFKIKSNNILLKLLLIIVKWILGPIIFFVDNENGIHLDKGFPSFDPFVLKATGNIPVPNEKTVTLRYVGAQYNRATKTYAPSSLELSEDTIEKKEEEAVFSKAILKREWNTYHIPAFTVILIVILLIGWLSASIFAIVIRDMPVSSPSENTISIIGMAFCSLVILALLVTYIVIIVKAHGVYKKVAEINT